MWPCCRSAWRRRLIFHSSINKRDGKTEESRRERELMATNMIERTLGSYEPKMHFHILQTDLFNEININNWVPQYLIIKSWSKMSPPAAQLSQFQFAVWGGCFTCQLRLHIQYKSLTGFWLTAQDHEAHLVGKFRETLHDSAHSLAVMHSRCQWLGFSGSLGRSYLFAKRHMETSLLQSW